MFVKKRIMILKLLSRKKQELDTALLCSSEKDPRSLCPFSGDIMFY